jgi:hypothetical protein
LDITVGLLGINQWFPSFCVNLPWWGNYLEKFCNAPVLGQICENIIPAVQTNRDYDTVFDNMSQLITSYPAGTSSGNIRKYAQLIKNPNGTFRRFDHG